MKNTAEQWLQQCFSVECRQRAGSLHYSHHGFGVVQDILAHAAHDDASSRFIHDFMKKPHQLLLFPPHPVF